MTSTNLFRPLLLLAAFAATGCDRIREGLPWERLSIASTSMEPTLKKGSYVTGESVQRASLARGDILFVRHRDQKWVVRLAGLPGDRIALVEGTVVLNGQSIQQRAVGRWKITDSGPAPEATMLSERFPGERRSHRVLDDGFTQGDNFEEIALGPDEYFLLGDNRDHAADSRYDNAFFGLGVLNGKDIERRLRPTED